MQVTQQNQPAYIQVRNLWLSTPAKTNTVELELRCFFIRSFGHRTAEQSEARDAEPIYKSHMQETDLSFQIAPQVRRVRSGSWNLVTGFNRVIVHRLRHILSGSIR